MPAERGHTMGSPETALETGIARGIVALDRATWTDAEALVDALGEAVGFYKVGLELFTAEGPAVVNALRVRGKNVFVDLKLHDIPNTVAGAARAAARHGASLLTVHAGGGADMMRAAAEAARAENATTRVIAVTALTSLAAAALPPHYRRDRDLSDIVLELTEEAMQAGADGVVLSGAEVGAVKERFGVRCLCVVPGVRARGGATHDQARVVTAHEALRDGADYVVIGRAVTAAREPFKAWQELWTSSEESA